MNMALTHKTAIVTGAGSGIGLAVVKRFLELDVRGVIAVDVKPDLALILDRECGGDMRVLPVVGDVAAESTAIAMTRAAIDRFGTVDVLVNNAAVGFVKPLHETAPEDWDRVMNANVKSIYWSARHVIPIMAKGGGGVILNAGSISGVAGIPGQGVYAASKGAVHQMTRQMAIEYAPLGIRVNAVCCGTVDTPLVHESARMSGNAGAFMTMLREGHPIGRIAAPAEVADAYAFLASDHATFFTGACIMLDGGYTAR